MSGFHITCTTCQSRLKVNDESAVGLILACPKCGSMVMVQPPNAEPAATAAGPSGSMPATAQAGAGSRHDSSAETRVDGFSLEDIDELAGPDARTPQPPPDAPAPLADQGEHASAPMAPPVSADVPTPTADEPTADEPTADPAAGPPAPGAEWISAESRRRKQWLLAGSILAFGLLGTVALVIYLVRGNETLPVAERGAGAAPAAPAAEAPKDLDALETNPAADTGTDAADTDPSAASPQPVDVGPTVRDPSLPPIPGAAEPLDPLELPETQPADNDSGTADAPNPDGATEETGATKAPGDVELPPPIGSPAAGDGNDSPLGDVMDPLSPLPAGDAGLSDLLNDEQFRGFEDLIEEAADLAPPAAPDPDGESFYNRFHAEVNPPRRPPGMHIDAPAQMAVVVPSLQCKDVPLLKFAELITGLSNVPITIDPHAVIHGRVAPDAPVTCRQSDSSLQALLDTAVAPYGLQSFVGQRHARLLIKNHNQQIQFAFPVDDLVADDADRQWLLKTLQEVVRPGQWAPHTPATASWLDDTQLQVRQTRLGMFESLQFLETLRVARGLPTRTEAPEGRFFTGSRRELVFPKLTKPTDVNFQDPHPFTAVLQTLTEQTGLQLPVDWHAIESKEWNIRAETTLMTHREPLAKALRLLLTPMQLDYLVLSQDVALVTTPESAEQWRELAIYPVADLVPPENDVAQALADVRNHLGPDLFAPESGNRLAFDSTSRSLIARLSQNGQRRVRELINAMRTRP